MRLTRVLTVTAVLEAPTGLAVLLAPATVLGALFGGSQLTPQALATSGVAGAGTLAVAVSAWCARRDARTHGQHAVLAGVLTFHAVVAGVLLYAGGVLGTAGVLLWPAVAYHVVLTAWALVCVRDARATHAGDARPHPQPERRSTS